MEVTLMDSGIDQADIRDPVKECCRQIMKHLSPITTAGGGWSRYLITLTINIQTLKENVNVMIYVRLLWPNDGIRSRASRSTLVQVMGCCLIDDCSSANEAEEEGITFQHLIHYEILKKNRKKCKRGNHMIDLWDTCIYICQKLHNLHTF